MADQTNTNLFFQIEGLDSLQASLRKISNDFDPYMLAAMQRVVVLIADDAKAIKSGRFKNRTGNLRRSIQTKVQSATRGIVYTDQAYAASVELGSKAHIIVPVNKKALAFKGSSGEIVFAKRVMHPGGKPYPFMQPAMVDNAENVLEIYATMFEQMANNT